MESDLADNFSQLWVDILEGIRSRIVNDLMTPHPDKSQEIPQLVQRRGFYLDIFKYAETRPVSLDDVQTKLFIEAYTRLKSSLGHASYTEVARALGIPSLQVMQHVKHLHIHSKEWEVRFSNNRHNENVFFKLLPK